MEERGAVRYQIRREHPLISTLQESVDTRAAVEPLLLAMETTLPIEALFADVAGNPQAVRQHEMEEMELEQMLAAFVEAMAPGKDTLPAAIANTILSTPVFAAQPTARGVLERLRRVEA